MMSQLECSGFLKEVDWDQYVRYRPRYPASLEKLIIDYHREHSNSFRLAHDVGSGSGVFAVRLAEYFQHVHVSDSNASFVDQARQRLDAWHSKNWWKARFTFSVTPAEKAAEIAARGSVDLVTLMQCAHWTDQDAMIESVARSLTSNGTLAIVQINPAPTVVGNADVKKAATRLFQFWGRNILAKRGGENSLMGTRYLPQGNSGVACVPLPDSAFIPSETRMIEINIQGRGTTPHAIPGLEKLVAPSRAGHLLERDEYTSKDLEGGGWRYEVEAEWFRGVVGTVEDKSNLHLYEDHLQAIENLMKTSSNSKIEIEWTVAVLLARRR